FSRHKRPSALGSGVVGWVMCIRVSFWPVCPGGVFGRGGLLVRLCCGRGLAWSGGHVGAYR
ncbi:MAG: hypothetical protein ABF705_08030, partial [Acetobacter syzygii]